MKEISVKSAAFLRLLLFYICFRSLLINTRLVFISYFVSVPLRKGHRGLEYKCLFYRLHLFLMHFWWFVLLSLLVLWFSCLHFWLFALELLVFVDCFVTLGFCKLKYKFLTLFRMGFDEPKTPSLKYDTHILRWWILAHLYLT